MYLGLDLSLSSSGAVIIDQNYKILRKHVLSTSCVGVERLFFLEKLLNSFFEENIESISMICIESPAYGISEGNLFNLGQWAGIVELALFKLGKKYIFASPSQLKKYVLGKGNGPKQLMLLKTFQNFQEAFENDNICDAYGLARIAHDYYIQKILKKEVTLKNYQLEVLNKINKTEEILHRGRLL